MFAVVLRQTSTSAASIYATSIQTPALLQTQVIHHHQHTMASLGDENAAARNSQNSILSAKVSRALEVRSDTQAMKAALDALAHLPDHQDDLFSVDSRSVRVAIEQDALQQALLLQDELKALLTTVGKLRQGVAETAAIAQRVEEAIHTNVITAKVGPSSQDSSSNATQQEAEDTGTSSLPGASIDRTLEQEQRLAALLSDAFSQRNSARKRVEAVHAFLEKFDLSEEDSRLLDHYSFDDVEASNVNGMAFLAALERVRLIRKELGRTFGTMDLLHNTQRSQRQEQSSSGDTNRLGASSALRMMEVLAQKQERAYERLYHWLQKYLHVHGHDSSNSAFGDDDHVDEALAHPFVRRSLYTLRNVPAFYSHLLELIAGSRRSEETRRFLLALTSGYGGLPPIEMRAHDSVVYVGDMLAFCFRSFSVEADVARGLLDYVPESEENSDGEEEKNDDVPLAEEEMDYGAEKPITAAEMLSQSVGGVSRPLKARILHVISSLSRRQDDDDDSDDGLADGLEEEGAATRSRLSQLYEICGLLLFYASAMGKTMAKLESRGTASSDGSLVELEATIENNPLLATLLECLGEAANAYEASLRVYGAMLEQLNIITGDSEALLAQAMVSRIVEVRRASPGFARDVACPRAHRQTLAIDWACDALIEAALPACKNLDDTVSLRQLISIARQAELAADVALALESRVHERETALIDILVEKETSDVLDLCGLGSLVTSSERLEREPVEDLVMATYPGLTPEDVQNAMSEFYSSLYSPPLPSFESTIKDPTLRKLARSKIAKNVCLAYESLYENMTRPDKGGYEDLSFLGHTPQQVNTLFTV